MQRDQFNALGKQGFNRIPLVKEVLADLETPLSLYVKLTQAFGKKNTYLLESVLGGERFGRFSFIGLPAKTIIRTVGTPTAPVNEVVTDGEVVETKICNPPPTNVDEWCYIKRKYENGKWQDISYDGKWNDYPPTHWHY